MKRVGGKNTKDCEEKRCMSESAMPYAFKSPIHRDLQTLPLLPSHTPIRATTVPRHRWRGVTAWAATVKPERFVSTANNLKKPLEQDK